PLRERFGLPVTLINDARAGVLGERWAGTARGSDNVVYITLSTGIGGGAVVNGRLLLGMNGNAGGEIGHIPSIPATISSAGAGLPATGRPTPQQRTSPGSLRRGGRRPASGR
ncbi:ROK family protein, partial [Methanoculleus chikugoensis]|uniref:ROK family protein n=1 Tax=Methanoculleus chikugoensis TaxID=118126 RepID=UPI000B2F8F54